MEKNKNNPAIRIVLDIIFFYATIFAPWWISLAIAILNLALFSDYYEVIISAIWINSTQFNTSFLSIPFFISFLGIALFWVGIKMKTFLKFSD